MARRPPAAAAALLAALALTTGCGGGDDPPQRLSREDGRKLADSRERLDDAIDTEETVRTSREETLRLLRRVRAIAARTSLSKRETDEFGIAALGRLRRVVPSLVLVDRQGSIRGLDLPAYRAFLDTALDDPEAALLRPARREVSFMLSLLDRAGAGPRTRIPVVRASAGRLLASVARDVRPIWPGLARRLQDAEL